MLNFVLLYSIFICSTATSQIFGKLSNMMKLTYFSAPGRAYVTRCCFHIAGVPFDDEILTFQQLVEGRGPTGASPAFPLGSMPVLTLPNGKVVVQSGAQLRYAAKLANLYPTDPMEALFVDEILETVSDLFGAAPQAASAEQKKILREEFAATKMKKFYNFFADKLASNPGGYIVGNTLTVADFSLYGLLKAIRSGSWDYISAEYDAQWPIFQSYVDKLELDPVLSKFKL